MKRTWFVLLASMLLAGLTAAMAQSLGEVARQQKANKKPPVKVYTNDDLSTLSPDSVSVVGEAAPPPEAKADDKGDSKAAPADKTKADDKAKAGSDSDKFKSQIADTKKQIASLEHDIDIMQREYRLRAATYYADAGNSLRDPKQWADQEKKYQDDLKTKQDSLNDLKQKLADLQEQGRQAGVPSADLE